MTKEEYIEVRRGTQVVPLLFAYFKLEYPGCTDNVEQFNDKLVLLQEKCNNSRDVELIMNFNIRLQNLIRAAIERLDQHYQYAELKFAGYYTN